MGTYNLSRFRSRAVRGFRRCAEAEAVLAFLRGETGSPRFGKDTRQALVDAGGLQLVRFIDCSYWNGLSGGCRRG
jgi:hypothetical protein